MLGTKLIKAASGSAGGDYQISRSLRFNSADSAYLSRTPASAGNQKTWTLSFWVKKAEANSSTYRFLWNAGNTSANDSMYYRYDDSETIYFYLYNVTTGSLLWVFKTNASYRDVGAWAHYVVSVDTTQAIGSDRVKFWVNGVAQTFATYNAPAQNSNCQTNSASEHNIGRNLGNAYYLNGYVADYHLIDGQALTPSSFGEVDEVTGVWKPIRYAGSYGTNGFHLDFSDNSSTTALGYDAAGSNDWTPNNFSVTAGAGNDSLVDSPTQYGTDTGAGGEVRGNYCTLNPLYVSANKTLSDGNLTIEMTSESDGSVGTIQPVSGKWYWEVTVNVTSLGNTNIGVIKNVSNDEVNDTIRYRTNTGSIVVFGSATQTGLDAAANGDVVGIALNLDDDEISFYLDNVQLGTTQSFSRSATDTIGPWCGNGNADTTKNLTFNFGQRPFAYTAPSGFKALCTTNLPDPTVLQGDDHFDTTLWTGNDTARSFTNGGFQPGLVWVKCRDAAYGYFLGDQVRGVTKYLGTHNTDAEYTTSNYITSFDSSGFSINSGDAGSNAGGRLYVGWQWKANGAGVSNTAGTITSTVSANTTAGISIVTYSGQASAGTVGHGLGTTPGMIIIFNRTNAYDRRVWHRSLPNTAQSLLRLNTTDAYSDDASLWNNTAPTSTVFSVGNTGAVNEALMTYVAYCFAEVEGFSKFGSYTGNSSATNGPFIFTGFRPAFVLIKRTDSTGFWAMLDNSRPSYNVTDMALYANVSNAESTPAQATDFLSNGFKLRTADSDVSSNGGTHIYMAFAENPFKYALAR